MKKVVFTFGRMNPPTTGHQLLVNKLVAYARQIGAAPRVYLSHSIGAKDPLQYDKKIAFARAAFGSLVKKSNARTVIEILKTLEKEGYTHVTMFAGSDRVPEFTKLLTKYNGKEYNFDSIEVKSAGERDPDADDVSGMSASKMRTLAKDEKIAEFIRGAPNTLKAAQAKNMYAAIRKALLGEDVMEYGQNERFLEFIFEGDNKEDDLSDLPSDGEIAKQFDNMDADDLDLDDADAMMLDIILGDEEESEKEDVKEAVLGFQQRQKLSQRMKAMSKRLARLREIKRKQMPAQKRLKMRARKAALMLLRKRATGKKNLDYSSLSRSQRIAVDTALMQRFGKKLNSLVGRLATRLMPRVRKQAQEYVKKAKEMKEGREVVYPGTAKMVPDQKSDNPLSLDANKLDITKIDPNKDNRAAPDPDTAHLHKNKKLRYKNIFNSEGRKAAGDMHVRDAGDTNIVYQMRKTINSRGDHETVFADGHKMHVSIADAKKLLAKFDALRLPADKQEFTIQAGKSMAGFRDVLAHGVKHQKKGISLGGKSFKEFYLGVGRSRTVSAYDNDEPPGTRRIAEVAKDEDRPEDPNRSRPLSQKMDVLMRLGLVDSDELQKYRRALRSSKKFALQSPELRMKLADLLDKLIDLTTKDPATYSRVRYNVVTKEAMALLNKAEKSGVDVDIIFEVFSRGYSNNEDINEAFARVNSFIAGGKAAELDNDLIEGEVVKTKLAQKLLHKKGIVGPHKPETDDFFRKWFAQKHIPKQADDADAIAYHQGTARFYNKKKGTHFDIKGGAPKLATPTQYKNTPISYKQDKVKKKVGNVIKFSDLKKKKTDEAVKEPTGGLKDACWKGYTAVGMKMKNGRKVPNCVPKEETQIDERNKENKSKKDAAVQKIGSQNRGSHWLHRMNPKVADKIRGREVTQGKDRQWDEQVDEVSAGLAHRAAHAAWIKADKNKPPLNTPTKMSHDEFRSKVKKFDAAVRQTKKFARYASKKTNEETQVDEVLDTTTSRMDYLQKAGKQMYGKGSADAKSQTFKKRLAGAKLFNRMTDRKPNVPLRKEEVEEGWVSIGATKPGGKPRTFVTDKSKYAKKKGVELRDPDPKPSPADKKSRFNESFSEAIQIKSREAETPYNTADDMMKNADRAKLKAVLGGLLSKMSPNQQKVIRGKYWDNKTLAQIAKEMKLSPVRVRQLEINVLKKLSTPVNKKKLRAFTAEQTSTHDAVPLSKRAKRVKSFHAWHPKPVTEVQRRADVKMVKAKLPDGRIVYRRERAPSAVQHEMYTGSEPTSGNRADPANRFVGTNAIRQNYASVTPGQGAVAGEIAVAKFAPEKVDYTSSMAKKTHTEVDQSKDNLSKKHLSDIRKALGGIRESVELNESFAAGFELAPFARDYGMRVQSSFEHHPSVQEELDAQEDGVNEAIYQGRNVPLNKPMKGDVKKSKVYVRDPSTGNIKKVNFGDKKLSIKKDQPGRKRSYCARSSGQGNLTKKTSANYWSRRAWDC